MKYASMNQMNQMNLFDVRGCIQKYFFESAPLFTVYKVHPCTSALIWFILHVFLSIYSILLVVWMYLMHMDEPIEDLTVSFVSCAVLANSVDERAMHLMNSNLHRGSSGSLREELHMKTVKAELGKAGLQ